MSRFSICLVLVVAAACVVAEECSNCPCGQECDPSGVCADGCLAYDKFIPVNDTKSVYGIDCTCVDELDNIGRIVECYDGDFVDAPTGDIWTKNPNCS